MYMLIKIDVCVILLMHACVHTCTHTQKHDHVCTHTLSLSHTDTDTYRHIQTHTHVYTHAQTHSTHTLTRPRIHWPTNRCGSQNCQVSLEAARSVWSAVPKDLREPTKCCHRIYTRTHLHPTLSSVYIHICLSTFRAFIYSHNPGRCGLQKSTNLGTGFAAESG